MINPIKLNIGLWILLSMN